MAKKARKSTVKSAKKAKKTSRRSLSVGPIWRAIEKFEDAARSAKPQHPALAKALKQLERAKASLPRCDDQAGASDHIPIPPDDR
jgi:hypothetical protein